LGTFFLALTLGGITPSQPTLTIIKKCSGLVLDSLTKNHQ
jgi:hypothetical protein